MSRKVFVSYSHKLDQVAADSFGAFFSDSRDVYIDKSVREDLGDLTATTIKSRLSVLINDSTVTVILIGRDTGGRSWVDWEIYHSLRQGEGITRNGLLGIYIPNKEHWTPDRLLDNRHMGLIINWPSNYITLSKAIEEAFLMRIGAPDLSKPIRQRNSSRS